MCVCVSLCKPEESGKRKQNNGKDTQCKKGSNNNRKVHANWGGNKKQYKQAASENKSKNKSQRTLTHTHTLTRTCIHSQAHIHIEARRKK